MSASAANSHIRTLSSLHKRSSGSKLQNEFIAFAAQAAQRLARRGSITAQQAAGWIVLDGDPIIWRGQDTVDTEPIVIFVNAMTGIIRGVYPHPTEGLHWYFGHPGDVLTI
jgi:hypothetical protein